MWWMQYVHKNEQLCISFVSHHHPNVLKIHIKNHIVTKLSFGRANVLKLLEKECDMHVKHEEVSLVLLCTFQEAPNVLPSVHVPFRTCMYVAHFVSKNPQILTLTFPTAEGRYSFVTGTLGFPNKPRKPLRLSVVSICTVRSHRIQI
jgi:hypothetical protein